MDVFGKSSVIVIVGCRRTGKTTAAKQLVLQEGHYMNLNAHPDHVPLYTDSCTILDNFQPPHQSMVTEYLSVAKNVESRVIIICQNYEDLGHVIQSKVDYILRRVESVDGTWNLNASNTKTNESFLVTIYPEDATWLLKEVRRQQQVINQIKNIVQ